MKVDLHLHTTYSDGILTPQNLVKFAKLSGHDLIAITDHDTVKGIPFAIDEGKKIGLSVIPGVEISAYDEKKEYHILGYYFNYEDTELYNLFEIMKQYRRERIIKILEKLRKNFSIDIPFSEIENSFKSKNYGRPHVAILLAQKGYATSVLDAFQKYLYDDGPCYVSKFYFSIKEAIDLIHKKGGIAVLAHPGLYFNENNFSQLTQFFCRYNFDGIEVFHPENTHILDKLQSFAMQKKLLITGGSDYHGYLNEDIFNFEIPLKKSTFIEISQKYGSKL